MIVSTRPPCRHWSSTTSDHTAGLMGELACLLPNSARGQPQKPGYLLALGQRITAPQLDQLAAIPRLEQQVTQHPRPARLGRPRPTQEQPQRRRQFLPMPRPFSASSPNSPSTRRPAMRLRQPKRRSCRRSSAKARSPRLPFSSLMESPQVLPSGSTAIPPGRRRTAFILRISMSRRTIAARVPARCC